MIGYDIYDRFTMKHFALRQRMTSTIDDQNLLLATVCNGWKLMRIDLSHNIYLMKRKW
jgi:hypothetical protein